MGPWESLRRRILVVDDDPDIRALLLLALDAEGFEVQAAADGAQALELLGAWSPHLILLDLWMPGMDGWAFRSQQLTRDALASIPVVVLTAGRNLQSRVDQLQAAAIVPKPFNLDALLGLTRALVGQDRPPLLASPN